MPGRKITILDGQVKGYTTYFRFVLDTYTQQILIYRASGQNTKGEKIFGYYYEVSGSGSSFVQGRAKNVKLFETLNSSLKSTNSAVSITGLKKENYLTNNPTQFLLNPKGSKNEIYDNLEKLKKLYEDGVITENEYKQEKKELLDEL